MRCYRDDSVPNETVPFTVRVHDRRDLTLTEVEHWLRDNGRGWFRLSSENDRKHGLTWVYRLSDRSTAFWLDMTFGGA
jgi:hypothetical protein